MPVALNMSIVELIVMVWLFLAAFPVVLVILVGKIRIFFSKRVPQPDQISNQVPIDILVPVKGSYTGQLQILEMLLLQKYDNYRVLFIVESDSDPAAQVIDKLCHLYAHARKIIAGQAHGCAQKNHNLICGLTGVREETEILLFCDSTNSPHTEWLSRLTAHIRNGSFKVVTTFRSFVPMPPTLGGICQSIYGAMLLYLMIALPKPWGGATAIKRELFDELKIQNIWSQTVVDDLVLGNALEKAGVKIKVDYANLLSSPLYNHTISTYMKYLDRQVLFPKFTNPEIWIAMMILYLNLVSGLIFSISILFLPIFMPVPPTMMPAGLGFLLLLTISVTFLYLDQERGITYGQWMSSMLPFIFVNVYVVLRSISLSHIDWHGKRYWPGKGGKILHVESICHS
jgi:hypothetical protein